MKHKVVAPNTAVAIYGGYQARVIAHTDTSSDRVLAHVYLERLTLFRRGDGRSKRVTHEPIVCLNVEEAFAAGFEAARSEINKIRS